MDRRPLYLAWFISIAAMLGSLYFSQVMHLPPCELCWYQRILMYPLVIILPIGIALQDRFLPSYVFPLSFLGMLIAGYHSLLQYHVIPDTLAPCALGVSCTTQQILLLGFITIPFMSFMAFFLIGILMVMAKRGSHAQ